MTTTDDRIELACRQGADAGMHAAFAHRPDHDDQCDDYDCAPSPLSGEWSGESMPEIYANLTGGRDYHDDGPDADRVLGTYEAAYLAAWELHL